MALRHALLSALSRGQALNGYKLSSIYSGNEERAWYASPSQIYAELTKMEAENLVAVEDRDDRGTDYIISEAGRRELRDWMTLTQPDHNVRDDSELRFMNFWLLDEQTAHHLIEQERGFQRSRMTRLQRKIEMYELETDGEKIWRNRRAVTELWLAECALKIKWLDGLAASLADEPNQAANIFNELRNALGAADDRYVDGAPVISAMR